MYRRLLCGLSALALALSACDSTEPALNLPVPSPAQEASPTPIAPPSLAAFTFDGVGPYQIGGDFDALKLHGLLADVVQGSQVCGDQYQSAHGVQPYQDIWISAKGGMSQIYVVVNGSTALATPSGAKVGSTLAQLKSLYGSAGEELNYRTRAGYLVKSPSGNGLLFDLDVNSKKVNDVVAGKAAYLKESFLFESDYC